MLLAEILIATFLAFVIGLVFFYGFRRIGPWGSFWAFIVILILAGIIGESWIAPIGPPVFGVSWLGAFILIFFFALLIAAATPTRRDEVKSPSGVDEEELRRSNPGIVALGVFFWFLLITMTIVAIGGLIYAPVA